MQAVSTCEGERSARTRARRSICVNAHLCERARARAHTSSSAIRILAALSLRARPWAAAVFVRNRSAAKRLAARAPSAPAKADSSRARALSTSPAPAFVSARRAVSGDCIASAPPPHASAYSAAATNAAPEELTSDAESSLASTSTSLHSNSPPAFTTASDSTAAPNTRSGAGLRAASRAGARLLARSAATIDSGERPPAGAAAAGGAISRPPIPRPLPHPPKHTHSLGEHPPETPAPRFPPPRRTRRARAHCGAAGARAHRAPVLYFRAGGLTTHGTHITESIISKRIPSTIQGNLEFNQIWIPFEASRARPHSDDGARVRASGGTCSGS